MSIILNKEELGASELRKNALEILEAGLEAINTEKILRRKILVKDSILNINGHFLDLKSYERVFFVGIGKCALDGAKVIENILGDRLTEGVILDVKSVAEAESLRKFKYFAGTHPYPSEQNIEATKQILEMVKDLNEKDLVITLISGGGSALFELPIDGVSLEDIINKTKELTAKGADIYELNAARKEMSQVKGGKFAEIIFPAHVVSLIFSDVLGNDISVVASGPTVLESKPLPFAPPLRGGVGEGLVRNILIASNADALEAMEEKAEELGFETIIETDRFSGNASEFGKSLAFREPKPKTCILFGGETTVKIKNPNAVGGRSQEVALSALPYIKNDSVLICAASDGWDNSDYAGAIIDVELFEKSKQLGLNTEEFLQKNESYNFFKQTGGAISTGRLGSNVSDLVIIIYK
jgi:glycerate 2-kinase